MSEVKVDTISERTTDAGVTIEGVKVEDGVATFQTAAGSPLVFEGATADDFETTFAITDPTADRTITFPNASVTLGDNKPAFHVYRTATQSIPTASYTKIAFDTAILDTASGFNLTASGTNPYAYTVSVAGTYLIQTGIGINNIDDGEYVRITVYKNGVRDTTADFVVVSGTSNESVQGGKCYLSSLAVDDYIELWIYHTEGASQDISGTQQFLSGFKII
jgi:hypothetical protein